MFTCISILQITGQLLNVIYWEQSSAAFPPANHFYASIIKLWNQNVWAQIKFATILSSYGAFYYKLLGSTLEIFNNIALFPPL